MKDVFLETGKSLLIFGNLGTILLFLKKFFISGSNLDLLWAISFFIGAYTIGNSFIYVSSLLNKDL